MSGEELTRLALRLLGSVAPRRPGGASGGAPPEARPVVWELFAERLVVGCENGATLGTLPADGRRRGRWTLRLDEAARAHPTNLGTLTAAAARATPAGRNGAAKGTPDAALVTVDLDPCKRVLADLVAAGVTTVSGDVRDRKAFVNGLAAELAERRWSPLRHLVLVGLEPFAEQVVPAVDALVVDDLLELDGLFATATGNHARESRRSRLAARTSGPDWATLVIVGPAAVGDRTRLARLVALAAAQEATPDDKGDADGPMLPAWLSSDAGRLAVVIGSTAPGARCTLVVAEGGARADIFVRPALTPNGPAHCGPLSRAGLGPDPGPQARVAVTAARHDDPPGSGVVTPSAGGGEPDPGVEVADQTARVADQPARVADQPARAEREDDSLLVEVAVLGPVEVRGVNGSLARRPKLTELVVFLAMHPGGATTSSWTTALWPRRRVPQQTIANRLSEARGLLGFASDLRPRLRRDGHLHVLAEVTTDWGRFQELALPGRGSASWREALALVRGRPFEDLPSGLWTAFECTAVEIERAVTECALRCGERLLAEGDPDGAAWAAHQGLRSCPWDERLHRLLMVTADAVGNRAGVEAALRHLALVLEVEGDPLRHVHPETAALYERLAGKSAGVNA